jgi:hypothetical protein
MAKGKSSDDAGWEEAAIGDIPLSQLVLVRRKGKTAKLKGGRPPSVWEAVSAFMAKRSVKDLASSNSALARWYKEEGGIGTENYIRTKVIPKWREENTP